MHVATCLDELWVGVKGQSNQEIARTPRNAFRGSLDSILGQVEILIKCRGFSRPTSFRQTPNGLSFLIRSEGWGAKVTVREGNNPDHQLRSQNIH